MTEGQCMHIVIQDPSLVFCASHESLGLLHRTDSKPLIVDSFEIAIEYSILLTLCLKNMFEQINVFHTHSFSIDYNITWNSLCCIVHHILLINQTIHLRSESHKLCGAMAIVFVLENGFHHLLVEVKE